MLIRFLFKKEDQKKVIKLETAIDGIVINNHPFLGPRFRVKENRERITNGFNFL